MDELHAADVNRYIRQFRAFLGQQRICSAADRIRDLTRTGNPYRELVLAEKQPWPHTFDEFDRLTLRGGRNLPLRHLSTDLFEAARAGKILENILPTMPADVQEQMRARLLDLHGKAFPVLMEWSVASFFVRRGYRLAWTGVGVAGPEFACTGNGVEFEAECKRSTRASKELLGDRDALSLGHALLTAASAVGFEGDMTLETTLTALPGDEQTIALRLQQLIPQPIVATAQIPVGEFGLLTVTPRQAPLGSREAQRHVEHRREARPHTARFFSAANSTVRDALALGLRTLYLIGPRRTTVEWLTHIEREMEGGVQQLSATRPGLLFAQIETVEDATLFRDKQVFRDIDARLLGSSPHLEAVVWQAVPRMPELKGNAVVGYEVFVERQPNRRFADGARIPLTDTDNRG